MDSDDSKKLTRALILNALVLPGSGHVSIGVTLLGVSMALATLVFLIAPIVRFLTAFQSALESQPPPGVSGSLGVVAAMGTAWKAHGGFIVVCLVAVLMLWAFGIADIARRIKTGREKGN